MKVQELTLIGFGAIGRAVYERMRQHERVRITHIVVSPAKVAQLQIELGDAVKVSHQVPSALNNAIAVRTVLPPISQRHLIRLPEQLQNLHHDWSVITA